MEQFWNIIYYILYSKNIRYMKIIIYMNNVIYELLNARYLVINIIDKR